ncbi:hypothetical protein [Mycoplasmopsis agassizii]|uniref:ABC transporter permease n=1 Tax=Mycoplasmopsis agassizii TaxID=33922 RepID=A0ABX4H5L6_9BACT|nr:hypothetical protein [Mycoplasmopsis agassizii]PAF55171.1 hypothetical protein CJF60_00595 [Mycoplasmopsis agassizii]SMC16843.1 hypothetical protein SAMN02745179_00342 [Mycoplasmopsis agassizii]
MLKKIKYFLSKHSLWIYPSIAITFVISLAIPLAIIMKNSSEEIKETILEATRLEISAQNNEANSVKQYGAFFYYTEDDKEVNSEEVFIEKAMESTKNFSVFPISGTYASKVRATIQITEIKINPENVQSLILSISLKHPDNSEILGNFDLIVSRSLDNLTTPALFSLTDKKQE